MKYNDKEYSFAYDKTSNCVVVTPESEPDTTYYYGLHCLGVSTSPNMTITSGLEEGFEVTCVEAYELFPVETVKDPGNTDPAGETPEDPDKADPAPEKPAVQPSTPEPELKSITLSGPSKIAPFFLTQLSIKMVPADAKMGKIAFTSSNTNYMTVSDTGIIYARKAGAGKTVTITAVMDGKKATKKITIRGLVKKIKLTGNSSVKAGKKLRLKANVRAGKYANKKLTWKSSNKKYATVTAKGVVKTKKAGKGKTVKITATAKDGSNVKGSKKIKIK